MTLPLKLYLTDADHVFKLNLYTIQNFESKDNTVKKNIFWRKAKLKVDKHDRNAKNANKNKFEIW